MNLLQSPQSFWYCLGIEFIGLAQPQFPYQIHRIAKKLKPKLGLASKMHARHGDELSKTREFSQLSSTSCHFLSESIRLKGLHFGSPG